MNWQNDMAVRRSKKTVSSRPRLCPSIKDALTYFGLLLISKVIDLLEELRSSKSYRLPLLEVSGRQLIFITDLVQAFRSPSYPALLNLSNHFLHLLLVLLLHLLLDPTRQLIHMVDTIYHFDLSRRLHSSQSTVCCSFIRLPRLVGCHLLIDLFCIEGLLMPTLFAILLLYFVIECASAFVFGLLQNIVEDCVCCLLLVLKHFRSGLLLEG